MNIVLVGFMATGKTAVGRVLAKRLNMRFVDIDELIVKREHRSISRLFKEEGEPYFRKIEKQLVNKASRLNNSVISTGGGAVLDDDNVSRLRRKGILICLSASPDELLKRIKETASRPLLNYEEPKKRISIILKKRALCYRKADINIKTDGLSIGEVAERIVKRLNGLRD